jgi:hypothetical protein
MIRLADIVLVGLVGLVGLVLRLYKPWVAGEVEPEQW